MSPLVVASLALLGAIGVGIAQVWVATDARWRAETVADIAAIAVAMSSDCAMAEAVATHNGVSLDDCRPPSIANSDATILTHVVVTLVRLGAGHLPSLTVVGRARAGF